VIVMGSLRFYITEDAFTKKKTPLQQANFVCRDFGSLTDVDAGISKWITDNMDGILDNKFPVPTNPSMQR